MKYTLRELDLSSLAHCSQWDRFAKSNNAHHHSTHFLTVIVDTFSHTNLSMFVYDDKMEIAGILPLVYIHSKLFSDSITSLPFFNYGGVVSIGDDVTSILIEAAKKKAQFLNVDNLQLRFSRALIESQSTGMLCETHKANMLLTLPSDMKMVGAGNAKKRGKLRSQAQLAIRKAQESNVEVKQAFGHLDILDDFYSVFSEHMRDLGTPVYSKSLFENMLLQFKDKATLTVAYWDGKAVSCGFLLTEGRRVSIPWASSLKSHNYASMNTHMYWNIIDHVITKGATVFDFGRSTIDAGTYKFKLQWGAEPENCFWYQLSNNKSTSSNPSAADGKFQLAIELWKKLPLFIANSIGPSIVKDIP